MKHTTHNTLLKVKSSAQREKEGSRGQKATNKTNVCLVWERVCAAVVCSDPGYLTTVRCAVEH